MNIKPDPVCKYLTPVCIDHEAVKVVTHIGEKAQTSFGGCYPAKTPICPDYRDKLITPAAKKLQAQLQTTIREIPLCTEHGLPVNIEVSTKIHENPWGGCIKYDLQAVFVCPHCKDNRLF